MGKSTVFVCPAVLFEGDPNITRGGLGKSKEIALFTRVAAIFVCSPLVIVVALVLVFLAIAVVSRRRCHRGGMAGRCFSFQGRAGRCAFAQQLTWSCEASVALDT